MLIIDADFRIKSAKYFTTAFRVNNFLLNQTVSRLDTCNNDESNLWLAVIIDIVLPGQFGERKKKGNLSCLVTSTLEVKILKGYAG